MLMGCLEAKLRLVEILILNPRADEKLVARIDRFMTNANVWWVLI